MNSKLDFCLDYLSDFSNLVIILAGIDAKPDPWKLKFEIDKEVRKDIRSIDKSWFKKQERKRKIGDTFEEWRSRCDDDIKWEVLERLNREYRKYWNSEKEGLKKSLEDKKKRWKVKFDSFFQDSEAETGLEWGRENYRNIVSDSLFMGGYWDPFDRNVVYTGAHAGQEIYDYVLPHELLHLLMEQENLPENYFNRDTYPELLTHDLMETLIPLVQGEVTSIGEEGAMIFFSHGPDRRWILLKKVIRSYKSDFSKTIEKIKSELDENTLEEYKRFYEREEPISILVD